MKTMCSLKRRLSLLLCMMMIVGVFTCSLSFAKVGGQSVNDKALGSEFAGTEIEAMLGELIKAGDVTLLSSDATANKKTVSILYNDLGIKNTLKEEKINQNQTKLTVTEGDITNVMIVNKTNQEVIVDGIPVEGTTSIEGTPTIAPRAGAVTLYKDTPFKGKSSDYSVYVLTYKHNVRFEKAISKIALTVMVAAVTKKLKMGSAGKTALKAFKKALNASSSKVRSKYMNSTHVYYRERLYRLKGGDPEFNEYVVRYTNSKYEPLAGLANDKYYTRWIMP